MNRAEFIRKTGGGVILAGIAVFTGYSVLRALTNEESSCEISPACSDCSKKASCKKIKQDNAYEERET